jgi:hypothetical protein
MRTTILRGLALAVGLLWCVMAVADDPPPDKLERKSRPPEQKKADANPPGATEKAKAPDKDKTAEQPKRLKRSEDESDAVEDPEKLKEQITKDMQSAEQKLKAYDPGEETQSLQDRVIKNLDKLLDLARNPPPSDQNQQQQQQRQQGQMGKQKSGQKQGQMSRRQERMMRRQQQERLARNQQKGQMPQGQQDQDQQDQNQQANRANPRFGGGNTSGKADKMSDIVKDIWGHLPETLRQEVDHYYRDQFMPRYRDLLQQYYSRLAEQERRARDGR